MSTIKKTISLIFLFMTVMANVAFAQTKEVGTMPGRVNNPLLGEDILISEGFSNQNIRGEFLAQGRVAIRNEKNGTITVNIDTYARKGVDSIYHVAFLDIWDNQSSSWEQVDYWEFEKTKEETSNGNLTYLSTSFTLSGYETNRYYRVRGVHNVDFNGDSEGCSSQTNGVLITDK